MNHKDLLDSIVSSMSAPAQEQTTPNDTIINDTIKIPFMTGRVYEIPAAEIDWGKLSESANELLDSENTLRAMMNGLVIAIAKETPEGVVALVNNYNESVDNLFKSFNLDPGYELLEVEVDDVNMLMAKLFDGLTLVSTLKMYLSIHSFSQLMFSLNEQTDELTNLSDLMDMNESTDGLIEEDRIRYNEGIPDIHDVSGLVSE